MHGQSKVHGLGQRREVRASWARFRATVATVAATSVVLVCLSYREQESNRLGNVPRNGDFFSSLAPSEDTIDSPNGERGFQLLQKGTPGRISRQNAGTRAALAATQGSRGVLVGDRLQSKARGGGVDFLSAGAARNQMKLYWQGLAQETRLEDAGKSPGLARESTQVSEADAPLTAGEARRQLEDYWDDLGSHDHVRSVRIAQRKMEAVARLSKKAKKAVDVVKDTSMDEMERIWSSEGRRENKATSAAVKNKNVVKRADSSGSAEHRRHVGSAEHGHHVAATEHPSAPDAMPAVGGHAKGRSGTGRYTSLPMCDHCSRQHFAWPVWNHRVDHALRVAENIAQGSHWNKTMHHVTVEAPDGAAQGDSDGADMTAQPAGTSNADLELEVESAMSTLRAAIAESKAEEVEQEAQEHGAGSTSLATAERTQCLTVCYSEVHSLVGFLAPKKPGDFAGSSAATRTNKVSVRGAPVESKSVEQSPVGHHPKLAGSSSALKVPAPASANTDTSSDDGDSIENAVDAVEEAVGDSEADAGKAGGNGVAAAVGAVEAAVAKDVDERPTHELSTSNQQAARSAAVAAPAEAPAPQRAGAGAEEESGERTAHGASKAASKAHDGTDVRRLEDSALNDAAEAQEEVRQGESELKHLKTLLARAHKLNRQTQESASASDAAGDAGADVAKSADIQEVSGLAAAASSQSLALAKAGKTSRAVGTRH